MMPPDSYVMGPNTVVPVAPSSTSSIVWFTATICGPAELGTSTMHATAV